MKKYYSKPESEITEFSAVEVITTSGFGGQPGIDIEETEDPFA